MGHGFENEDALIGAFYTGWLCLAVSVLDPSHKLLNRRLLIPYIPSVNSLIK